MSLWRLLGREAVFDGSLEVSLWRLWRLEAESDEPFWWLYESDKYNLMTAVPDTILKIMTVVKSQDMVKADLGIAFKIVTAGSRIWRQPTRYHHWDGAKVRRIWWHPRHFHGDKCAGGWSTLASLTLWYILLELRLRVQIRGVTQRGLNECSQKGLD